MGEQQYTRKEVRTFPFYGSKSYINRPIDKDYVSGLSITYSSNPRQHIWTFASGRGKIFDKYLNCPCSINGGYDPPSYVGSDYITVSQAQHIRVIGGTHIILMTHCGTEQDV